MPIHNSTGQESTHPVQYNVDRPRARIITKTIGPEEEIRIWRLCFRIQSKATVMKRLVD